MKQTTQHTDGTWHLGLSASERAVYGPRGEAIATLPDMLTKDEILANAKLIAASPDLLTIAKRWFAWSTAGAVQPIDVRLTLEADTRAAIVKTST